MRSQAASGSSRRQGYAGSVLTSYPSAGAAHRGAPVGGRAGLTWTQWCACGSWFPCGPGQEQNKSHSMPYIACWQLHHEHSAPSIGLVEPCPRSLKACLSKTRAVCHSQHPSGPQDTSDSAATCGMKCAHDRQARLAACCEPSQHLGSQTSRGSSLPAWLRSGQLPSRPHPWCASRFQISH